jgi:tripartite-type tricarboxylate transporter receptor subunit TctC
MIISRRRFLHALAVQGPLAVVLRDAQAQSYPTRSVHLIVGFAPGGGADIAARLIGQGLSTRLGQQFVVENRPGAGANIAMDAIAKAVPDGYTLLLVSPGAAINPALYKHLNYDFMRDIAPVCGILRVPNLLVVHPSVPANNVPEFIAYARSNSGKVNMGSAGIGSSVHASGELFKMMAGVNLIHAPYRGAGPMLIDLLAGQVQVAFPDIMSSIEYVRAGKLRALAVTTHARSTALPQTPSIAESIPGYEASNWWGLGAPKNTSGTIIEKINDVANASLAAPAMSEQVAAVGGIALLGRPDDFGRLISAETAEWKEVFEFAGFKAQ